MKKYLLTVITAFGLAIQAFSQVFFENVTFTGALPVSGTSYTARIAGGFTETFANGDWTSDWTNFYPQLTSYPAGTEVIQGDITADRTISTNAILRGTVHVKNGATLTINAGTVIRCESGSSLLITKGSKINAVGTRQSPIVFTSSKDAGQRAPGDWAGILLIGNSQVNTASGKRQYEALPNDPLAEYGGGRGSELNLDDNSGEMRFVRIEYAGYNYLPDQELNGLTFGAVGKGTRVNFVQVSYARDDSFEWFGGTSDHKYLVAFGGVDDDFDMDEGYNGKVQFILGIRDPQVFETAAGGTSNGFEHDNNTGLGSASAVVPGNNNPTPNTAPLISNATMIGPWVNGAPTAGNKFGRGLEIRSAVATSLYNSVVIGYNTLAQLVHPSNTITPSTSQRLQNALDNADTHGSITRAEYKNVHLIANNTGSGFAFTSSSNSPITFNFGNYMNATNGNTANLRTAASSIFSSVITNFRPATAPAAPSYTLQAGSPVAAAATDFTGIIAPFTADPDVIAAQPFFSVDKSSINFGSKQLGQTFTGISIQVTAANLTGAGISISSSSADFSVSPANLPVSGGSFTVTVAKTTAGAAAGNITIASGDGRMSNIVVPVSANFISPAAPILNVDVATLAFPVLETTTSASYTSNPVTVNVSGRNLTANVTVTAPAGYEIAATPTGTYGSQLILERDQFRNVASSFSIRLNTNATGSNAGTVNVASGAVSTSFAVSANTNPSFTTSSSITIDYFNGQVYSTVGAGFNVRGDRLPGSITITPNTPDILVSNVSANGPFTSTIVLTTTGRITSSSNNLWVRYVGATPGSTSGVQVGTISVSGVPAVIAVTLRLNNAGATTIPGCLISTDVASNIITSSGCDFTTVFSSNSTAFLYTSGNAVIGRIAAGGISANEITLTGNAAVALTDAPFKRPGETISVTPGSPLSFNVSSFTNGVPNPVSQTITITGSNHNGPVNVGINPALSLSGYMFEVTTTPGTFSTTLTPGTNGELNQTLVVRYVPSNITTYSLTGVNVIAAHSTELLVLRAGRTLAQGATSGEPRATIAYNLRGNSQPSVTVGKTDLAKFTTYRGVYSPVQKFSLSGSRLSGPIVIDAPDNFEVSTSETFTSASNMLTIETTVGVTFNGDIFVRYKRNDVGSDNGAISVAANGIASLLVNVSGEAYGYDSFINVETPGGASTITFPGTIMVTVSGDYLTAPVAVTASNGFGVSLTETGTPVASVTINPAPADFGGIAPTVVYVTFQGTGSGTTGTLTASSAGATNVVVNLVSGFPNAVEDIKVEKVVTVYPNPAEGEATLAVDFGFEKIRVDIINTTGVAVQSFNDTVTGLTTYPISGLPSGVYVISVRSESAVKIVRLVVK